MADRFLRRLAGPRHVGRVLEYAKCVVTLEEALATAVDVPVPQVRAVLSEPELRDTFAEARERAAGLGLPVQALAGHLELCYAICRLLQPRIAIETGVGYGWTTTFILRALEKNGMGCLHSVELAAFAPRSKKYSGIIVPDQLKHRWLLHMGLQHRILPRILDENDSVDFVHYDSDKTYQGMKRTYQLLWPRLSAHGILVSDDLNNDAFLEFAESHGVAPLVVIKPDDRANVGIMVRK